MEDIVRYARRIPFSNQSFRPFLIFANAILTKENYGGR